MAQRFRYTGFSESGSPVSGSVDAQGLTAAREALSAQGVFPTTIKAERAGKARLSLGGARAISLQQMEQLMTELALLIRNGVTIDDALRLLTSGRSGDAMAQSLASVHRQVRSGARFSDALDQHMPSLAAGHRRLIQAGEESGQLSSMLDAIASDLSKSREVRARVQQAMVYPIILGCVSLLSVLFVLGFVVPRLAAIFSDPALLPWYTRLLLALSDVVQAIQLQWVAVALIAAGAGVLAWGQDARQRAMRLVTRLPFFRSVQSAGDRVAFFSGVATLLRSGVPADQALQLARESMGSESSRQEASRAVESVRQGQRLATSLGATTLLTTLERSMITAGEAAGDVASVFAELADRNRKVLDARISTAVTVLEPLLIVVTGVIVGAIVVIMMLSVVSVNELPL